MPQRSQADSEDVWPSSAWKQKLRRSLLAWYQRHARDLPWRRTSDAYQIWISEVMLQQTQVATVAPYFARFLESFPTVNDLAAAEEEQVLKLWEGLGYYRRARQLHKAARVVQREHGGVFPRSEQAVRSLPGIGRYTAGAILSIAYDDRQPILEANTVRLFCRLLAYRGDPSSTDGQRLLWQAAEDLLPRTGSGMLNQALMDLGSQICVPQSPRCLICPLKSLCPTNLQGLQAVVPCPRKKPVIEQVREVTVVVRRRGRVLLLRRTGGTRWIGLWDFPRFAIDPGGEGDVAAVIRNQVESLTSLKVNVGSKFATLKHGVTRFRITLDCYEAHWLSGQVAVAAEGDAKWVAVPQLADYPLSVTGRKIAGMLAASAQQPRVEL